MKLIQFFTTAFLAATIFLASCSKDNQTPGGSTESGFHYAENGSSTFTKADETQANAQYKTITAKKGTNLFEIVLTDLKPGAYSLAGKYAFSYIKNGSVWESSAGTLTITKNEGGKLSGTFAATQGSGAAGVNSVEGKFNDVSIK